MQLRRLLSCMTHALNWARLHRLKNIRVKTSSETKTYLTLPIETLTFATVFPLLIATLMTAESQGLPHRVSAKASNFSASMGWMALDCILDTVDSKLYSQPIERFG